MSNPAIVIFCGLLLSVSAFSVDITLPAFSFMADDLAAPYSQIQLVVPVFLACIGVGQIFSGPLSDRFGRKPVMLGGLALFAAGSVVCVMAGSIDMLLAGRALQGLGASGGPVVARAVLRDLFSGRQLASNIALATMVFAFGPIVAPLAGVGLMQFGGWRFIFLAILAFGLLLLAFGVFRLPETIRERDLNALRAFRWRSNLAAMLGNRQSRTYTILFGPIMTMMILLLVAMPRVYDESFGITGTPFAFFFAYHGVGIIIGQYLNRIMIVKIGVENAMLVGSVISVAVSVMMFLLEVAGLLNAYVLSACLMLFAIGFLTIMANAMALALDPHGTIAGFVSSIVESSGRIVASLAGAVFAWVIGGDVHVCVIALLATTVLVLISLLLVRKTTVMRENLS